MKKDYEVIKNLYKHFLDGEGGKDFRNFLADEERKLITNMFKAETQEQKASAVDRLAQLVVIRDKFLRMAGVISTGGESTHSPGKDDSSKKK